MVKRAPRGLNVQSIGAFTSKMEPSARSNRQTAGSGRAFCGIILGGNRLITESGSACLNLQALPLYAISPARERSI